MYVVPDTLTYLEYNIILKYNYNNLIHVYILYDIACMIILFYFHNIFLLVVIYCIALHYKYDITYIIYIVLIKYIPIHM